MSETERVIIAMDYWEALLELYGAVDMWVYNGGLDRGERLLKAYRVLKDLYGQGECGEATAIPDSR